MLTAGAEPTSALDSIARTHHDLGDKYREALKSFDPARPETQHVVDKLVRGIDRPMTDAVDGLVADMEAASRTRFDELDRSGQTQHHDVVWSMLLVLAIGVVAAAAVAFDVVRGVTRPLLACVGVSNQLALGDLTVRIGEHGSDETGQLMAAMGRMTATLSKVLGDVSAGAQTVAAASEQVAATSQSLSLGTSSQAALVEETSATLEDRSCAGTRSRARRSRPGGRGRLARTGGGGRPGEPGRRRGRGRHAAQRERHLGALVDGRGARDASALARRAHLVLPPIPRGAPAAIQGPDAEAEAEGLFGAAAAWARGSRSDRPRVPTLLRTT
jgi:HAMP domain-containing protein